MAQNYSQHSFYPLSKQLKPIGPLSRFDLQISANRVNERINSFVENKRHFHLKDLQESNFQPTRVGIYGELGRGTHSEAMLQDLMTFLSEQTQGLNDSPSFWAVFYDSPVLTHDQFENRAEQELSYLRRLNPLHFENQDFTWGANNSLIFEMNDHFFSIMGLHMNSPFHSRQFFYPSLLFPVIIRERG